MKLGNRASTGLALSLALVMIVSFQNCGKKMSTESLSPEAIATLNKGNEGVVNAFDHSVVVNSEGSEQSCPVLEVDRSRAYGHGIEIMSEQMLLATFNSLFAHVRVGGTKYDRGFVLEIRELYERKFGKQITYVKHASDSSLETDRSRSYGHGIEDMSELRLLATFNSLRILARDKYDRGFLAEIRELYERKFGKQIPECPFWDYREVVAESKSAYITIASKTNKAAPLTSVPDPENPGFGKVTSICTLCANFVDLLPGQDARTLDAYKIAYFNQNRSSNDFITKVLVAIKKAPTTDYYHGIFTEETLLHAIAEYAFLKDLSAEQEQALVDLYNQLK